MSQPDPPVSQFSSLEPERALSTGLPGFRLEALFQHLGLAILMEDQNRKVVLVNQVFCDIFAPDASPEQLVGADCEPMAELAKHLFADPEDFILGVNNCLKLPYSPKSDLLRLKNGLILEREFIPIERDGQSLGFLWKYRDTTQTQKLLKALSFSEEKYRGIIENMELGLMEVDIRGDIVKVYPAFCKMTGYTPDELLGKNANQIFLDEASSALMEKQDQERAAGKTGLYQIQIFKKDETPIWVLISGAPIYDMDGQFTGSIGIHYDITELKQLQEKLEVAKHEAESARDAEKQFLANMSHEIRNPINAILGMTNLLYDTQPTVEQRRHLDAIKYSSEILQAILSDVLDIAKIQEGKLEAKLGPVHLGDVIRAACQTASYRIGDLPLTLETDIDPTLEGRFESDVTFLNQILINLLNNAIKFTEKGVIRVSLRREEGGTDPVNVVIVVADTGIGIDPEEMPHIFDRFRQGTRESKLTYGGAGLGLFICKQLTEILGGTISAESVLNRGTAFHVRLPMKPLSAVSSHAQVAAPLTTFAEGLKALIVEDNNMNRRYLEGVMKLWNYAFVSAVHGAEALSFLEKERFDLILMDIRMPVMDGYEATLRLRSMAGNPNQNIPIIALTASALLDEKAKALSVGMNEHLSKPFTPEQLQRIIQQVVPGATRTIQAQPASFWPRIEGIDTDRYNLLYGEDKEHALMMIDMFLDMIPSEVELLVQAGLDGVDKEAVSIIHKIKPSLGMVGLTHLEKEASQLERSIPKDVEEGAPLQGLVNGFVEKIAKGMEVVAGMQHALKGSAEEPVSAVVQVPAVVQDSQWDQMAIEWLRAGKPLLGPEGLVQYLMTNHQSLSPN